LNIRGREVVRILWHHISHYDDDPKLTLESVKALKLYPEVAASERILNAMFLLLGHREKLHIRVRKEIADTLTYVALEYDPGLIPEYTSRMAQLLLVDAENRVYLGNNVKMQPYAQEESAASPSGVVSEDGDIAA
jgi:hypothetical protein